MKVFRRRLRRAAALIVAVVLTSCSHVVPAPSVRPGPGSPQDAWARVLDRFVDDRGRVDFAGLARERDDLDRFVAWVYATAPGNYPERFPIRAAVLAYHLNAYNALAMYNMLDAGIPESLGGLRKLSFFYLREVTVGGKVMSLYAYENDIIRPLGEERVHFALNCMVVSCPRLPRTAFRAETLDADLDREAVRFLNEERNVKVDPARQRVWLSEILDFYPEDFLAKAPSLVAYANRFRATPIPPDYSVAFIPYDWTVNRQGR
jgi:hypothetical protein